MRPRTDNGDMPDLGNDRRLTLHGEPGASITTRNSAMGQSKLELLTEKWQEAAGIILHTTTRIPLLLDMLFLKSKEYVAITKEGHAILIRPKSGEHWVFYECLIRKQYLRDASIKRGDIVFDVGANVGCFAVLASSIVGPSGVVVAVEPDPDTFKQLARNVETAGLNNIVAINSAISDHVGKISFKTCSKSVIASSSRPIPGKYNPRNIEVPCTTLEKIMADNGLQSINLLKMDCQGAEHEVFSTISDSVADRIDQIVMEMHGQSAELVERLKTLNYEIVFPQPIYAHRNVAELSPVTNS